MKGNLEEFCSEQRRGRWKKQNGFSNQALEMGKERVKQ